MGIIACERTASPDKAMFDRLDAALGGRRPVFVSVFASPALDLGDPTGLPGALSGRVRRRLDHLG